MGKCNKVNEIDMGIMEMEMFSCKIQHVIQILWHISSSWKKTGMLSLQCWHVSHVIKHLFQREQKVEEQKDECNGKAFSCVWG